MCTRSTRDAKSNAAGGSRTKAESPEAEDDAPDPEGKEEGEEDDDDEREEEARDDEDEGLPEDAPPPPASTGRSGLHPCRAMLRRSRTRVRTRVGRLDGVRFDMRAYRPLGARSCVGWRECRATRSRPCDGSST